MGSSTQKSTSSTAPSNPALNSTITKLSKGIGDLYQPGGTSYVAPSSTTTGGWQSSLNAAGNPAFASGINGAMSSYADVAAGNQLGMNDPRYAALRDQVAGDVMNRTNRAFNNSGMFGSMSNQRAAASGLADALGRMDYQQLQDSYGRQTQAATLMPQLFAAGQLPASIQQSVGASMDADAQAQKNGQINYLGQITGLVSGASGAAGTTTTNTTPTAPLWQQLLGLGLQAL